MKNLKFVSLVLSLFVSFFSALSTKAATLTYLPSELKTDSAKVLVVIHGCLQSAESMALGSGFNQIAEKNNMVVIYPQVPEGLHPLGCWGWYLPENQRRDSGQLKAIMTEVKKVTKSLKLKKPEMYLAGISSGGATVAGLMACFPHEFKAAALHSSPSYGLAKDLASAEKVLKEGASENPLPGLACRSRDFTGSVIVIQGTADPIVNPKHGTRILSDFIGPSEVISEKEVKTTTLTYKMTDSYSSAKGAKARLVMVQGLGHVWAGFKSNLRHSELLGPQGKFPTTLPFFAEQGPNSTQLIWDFFSETSRPRSSK